MAIVVGTPTTGAHTASYGSSVYGFDHTTVSGVKLLIFAVGLQSSGNDASIDTATWNGTSMVLLALRNADSGTRPVAIFALVNPDIGSYDVRFHQVGTFGIQADHMFAVDVTGTFTSNTVKGNNQTSGDNNPSLTFTVQGSAGVIFDLFIANTDATPDGSQTSIFSAIDKSFYKTGASYKAHSGSNTTMSYTGSTDGCYAGTEIKEGTDFVPRIQII